MYSQISDATDGTEDGNFFIETVTGGADKERIGFYRTGTIINQDAADVIFV